VAIEESFAVSIYTDKVKRRVEKKKGVQKRHSCRGLVAVKKERAGNPFRFLTGGLRRGNSKGINTRDNGARFR